MELLGGEGGDFRVGFEVGSDFFLEGEKGGWISAEVVRYRGEEGCYCFSPCNSVCRVSECL